MFKFFPNVVSACFYFVALCQRYLALVMFDMQLLNLD